MSNQVIDMLNQLKEQMNASPKAIAHLDAQYAFQLKEGWQVYVCIEDERVSVSDALSEKQVDCTIILSEKDMLKLLSHQLNAAIAYMTGAIKVEGKIGPASKLLDALNSYKN